MLESQISLDGTCFVSGKFPPSMRPETHVCLFLPSSLLLSLNHLNQAYTVLESTTSALFMHMTMSEAPTPCWGTILKSNSNNTYLEISIENVNRDERGFVDFEKMIALDGIAFINVVSNINNPSGRPEKA